MQATATNLPGSLTAVTKFDSLHHKTTLVMSASGVSNSKMAGSGEASENIPDLLFHIILNIIHPNFETGSNRQDVYILGTCATLEAAKRFAKHSLSFLGYSKDEFDIYEEKGETSDYWDHGDGVIAYGKTPAEHEVLLTIDTKTNAERLQASSEGTIMLPNGVDHLHYVLQTMTDYNTQSKPSVEIEGAYAKRPDAFAAAKRCLIDDNTKKEDFAHYDERNDLSLPQDWPFGEDVIVHAIALSGQNYLVSLKTPPAAYQRHRERKFRAPGNVAAAKVEV